METIYQVVESNPAFFTWVFGVINVLWGIFLYFNKKSHAKEMEALKSNFKLREVEISPVIARIHELEELAGVAKEVANSYRSTEDKFKRRSEIYPKLDELAGKLSKYPKLMQAIRDLNHYCALMAESDVEQDVREEIEQFYRTLLTEAESVRRSLSS